MHHTPRLRSVTWVAMIVAWIFVGETFAEPPVRQRAVDVFSLRDGRRLLGVSLSPSNEESPTLLMNAQWLAREEPELYESLLQQVKLMPEPDTTLVTRMTSHLKKLRETTPEDIERIGFLQERLTDIQAARRKQETFDFVVLQLSSNVIRRKFLQKPAVQKIGGLALLNRIPNVETLSATDVNAALQKRAGKAALRTELPREQDNPTDTEFVRILARAERHFGKPCRLIRYGGQYINAEGNEAGPEQLLPQMLQGQLQTQFGNLLADPSARPPTIKPAANTDTLDPKAVVLANQSRLVEVSQLDMNPAAGSASVQIDLYFKAPEQSEFRRITTVTGKASSNDISAEQVQRIGNDPRVKQISQLFRSLGTGAGDLTKAMSVGAAVEVAQNQAHGKLAEYFTNETDGPTGSLKVLRASLPELPAIKKR